MGMLCCIYGLPEDKFPAIRDDLDALEDWFEEFEDVGELDKAWHGIHFLLTGSPWDGEPPLGFILNGGTPISGTDEGYGEVRFFGASEVAEISRAISAVSIDELRNRFDPVSLVREDIYPAIWGRRDEDAENLDYLIYYFRAMRDHLSHLADERRCCIVSIR